MIYVNLVIESICHSCKSSQLQIQNQLVAKDPKLTLNDTTLYEPHHSKMS